MRVQFIVTEAALSLRRNVTMTVAAIVTITIAATLLGGALMTRNAAQQLQYSVLNQIEVSVYLQDPCGTVGAPADCLTPADQANVQRTLQDLPQVKAVTYLSKTNAFARFKRYFADNPELIASAGPNALPASFEVQLKDPHQFAVVDSAVSRAHGVQSVTDASKNLAALFGFFKKFELGIFLVAIFLLAACTLLIYNTMRVAAFSRRRETGIMRLVGATDYYIQAPFVLEAIVIGTLASALAIGLLAVVRGFVSTSTRHSEILRPFGAVGPFVHAIPAVVAIGIVLPAIASVFSLRRHLRAN